jgi:hypothetical protein
MLVSEHPKELCVMTNERRTFELSDAELDHVSGGTGTAPVLVEGNGTENFQSNAPNTPAAQNGFKGNGASIRSTPC